MRSAIHKSGLLAMLLIASIVESWKMAPLFPHRSMVYVFSKRWRRYSSLSSQKSKSEVETTPLLTSLSSIEQSTLSIPTTKSSLSRSQSLQLPARSNFDVSLSPVFSRKNIGALDPDLGVYAQVDCDSRLSSVQLAEGCEAARKMKNHRVSEASSRSSIRRPRSLKFMASESVAWTLKRMAESPLLSAEQELVLGRYTQRLGVFEMVRNGLRSSLEREPTLLEWATATNYTGGGNSVEFEINRFQNDLALGRRAKEQLVNSNMRLVVSIARRYQSLGVSLQDLIQEGSLGLIRAAEKYDPSRGFRFSTYASWWIQQAVFRAVAFQSRIIRLPMHIHNLLNRARNTRKDMFMETGVIPSDVELAERLGVSADKLRLVLTSSKRTYSSSAPLKMRRRRGAGSIVESDLSFEDTWASQQAHCSNVGQTDDPLPEDFVEELLFRSEIYDVLDVLDDDERFVVTLRYGLGVPRRLSMSQIADMAGMCKVWVKKMEQRALRKLRRPHHQMKLRPFSIDRCQLDSAVKDLGHNT